MYARHVICERSLSTKVGESDDKVQDDWERESIAMQLHLNNVWSSCLYLQSFDQFNFWLFSLILKMSATNTTKIRLVASIMQFLTEEMGKDELSAESKESVEGMFGVLSL